MKDFCLKMAQAKAKSWRSLSHMCRVVSEAAYVPQFSISGQLLRRTVKRFRGGFVFKAHRLLYHSTLGSIVMKKKKKKWNVHREPGPESGPGYGKFEVKLILNVPVSLGGGDLCGWST